MLLLPLPYQPEYKAVVNGKVTELVKVFDDLVAVRLQEGENLIELSIVPQGIWEGLIISSAGIVLFIFFLCLIKKLREKRYPKLELTAGLLFTLIFIGAFLMVYIFPFFIYLIF